MLDKRLQVSIYLLTYFLNPPLDCFIRYLYIIPPQPNFNAAFSSLQSESVMYGYCVAVTPTVSQSEEEKKNSHHFLETSFSLSSSLLDMLPKVETRVVLVGEAGRNGALLKALQVHHSSINPKGPL